MNSCKTIDYKISIYPTIIPCPSEVVLSARIILPDNNTLVVQQSINRMELAFYRDEIVKAAAANFVDQISRELSMRLMGEAILEIDRQM